MMGINSVILDAASLRQLCCAPSFSQGLADNAVISRVNGELWDLDRPLERDCSLEILRFDNEDAQAVSTNHADKSFFEVERKNFIHFI